MTKADLFDLTGKVAIVTGSTKGIGRAMVDRPRRGRRHRRREQPQAGPLRDRSRRRWTTRPAANALAARLPRRRLGRHPGVRRHRARRASGRIDVLVNNAGITRSRLRSRRHGHSDVWRKIFNVNVEGPLRMAQCVAPIMRDQGGGSIVNIASMAAYTGGPLVCAYGASKAALVNLTKSMARSGRPGTCGSTCSRPGPFLSEMVDGAERNAPGFKDMIAAGTLQQRVADPDEIVGPVLYLASDASSFVTGDDISVSGGMRK